MAFLIVIGSGLPLASRGQILFAPERFCVVDIIPNTLSWEAFQNAEPSLGVGTGPFYGDFVVHAFNAPPFPLVNFDYTAANSTVAWSAPATFIDYDCTLDWSTGSFVSSDTRDVYAAMLSSLSSLEVRRSSGLPGSFPTIAAATYAPPHAQMPDQPWIKVVHVPPVQIGHPGVDHIYVGFNDLSKTPGKTSSIRYSLDSGYSWTNVVIEKVNPGFGQDSAAVRLAASLDGKIVYALFERYIGKDGLNLQGDVVLTRDDNLAGTFNALPINGNGGNDGVHDTQVAIDIKMPLYTSLGSQRLASNCDIAVDPLAPNVVYVAYTTAISGGSLPVIKVHRSIDSGKTFGAAIYTVEWASLPALAVLNDKSGSDISGTVGLLYAAKSNLNLEVNFLKAPFGSFAQPITRVLATWPDNNPKKTYDPYIGDYFQLRAVGFNFYGTFCASDEPKTSHFPSGVYFQRNVQVGTTIRSNFWLQQDGTLYDVPSDAVVSASIDPFFFCDIAATHTVIRPRLYVVPGDPSPGTNRFFWPVLPPSSPQLQLQSSPVLGPLANWTVQTNSVIQTNGQFESAEGMSQPQQFFRLSQDVADGQFRTFASVDSNGSLNPSGILTNNGLTSRTFTATHSNDYAVGNWYLDGVAVQSSAPALTISNISSEHTLAVTFVPSNDVAVTVVGLSFEPEDPVMVTNAFSYQVDIANTGLEPVTGVTMTNILDPTVSFVSAVCSQGSITNSGNLVTASLGALSNGALATITMTVVPNAEATITNIVSVACSQFEPNLENNTATAINSVIMPVTIEMEPTNQTVNLGDTATFSVEVSGTPPFVYQWLFNDMDIVDATNATLTVTNVTATNTGFYAVVVFQVFGPETILEADSQTAELVMGPSGPSPTLSSRSIGTSVSFHKPKTRRPLR